MKNHMRKAKEFVARHKTGITLGIGVVVGATIVHLLENGAVREANDFIEEQGLTEQFIERMV